MRPLLRICTLWLAVLLSGLSQRALAQSVRYATPTGAGTRDGSSWTNALSGTALQGTLATAPSGTTVLVAAGLYKPTTTTDRNITFSIPAGVEVYGGYTAGTTNRTTNPSSTTLSGDIDSDNTLAGNTYKVVTTGSGTVVIDGLVVTGGDARPLGFFIDAGGGGLFAGTGSLVVRTVQFINNAAKDGGGLFLNGITSATITNCTFTSNIATGGGGGGLYVNGTGTQSVVVSGCRFVTNGADTGGAVYNNSSSPSFTNCLFINNTSSRKGGGIYNDGAGDVSSPSLTNCSFAGNTATGNGGGIYNDGAFDGVSSPSLTNCSFAGNTTTGNGGGIYNDGAFNGVSSPSLTNCSFTGNSATRGGGMYNAGAFNGVSSPSLTNCIIWANSSGIVNDSANPTYSYTDLQGGIPPGTGNRSVDPLFVDVAGGNLQLSACSPLIDAGDNGVSVPNTDGAGNPRRQRTIDFGAFEFQGALPTAVAITQQPASGSTVCASTAVSVSISTTGTVTGYQWYQNGSVVSGQTSATLTLPNTSTTQSGSYSVVVTGNCNSVTSTAFSLTVTPQSPDYQPLVDLYNATNGPNWTNKTNWLMDCSPCGWYGVTCDGSGRVTQLDLTRNGLAGPIPASLSQLTSLQTLRLLNNQLSGPIPASLSNLTNLNFLGLGRNQLTGTIPPDLSKLTSLTVLAFDNNNLEGTIPASLSALTNLQAIFLSANQLSGSIPAYIGSLSNLDLLWLDDNQLSGMVPASLGNLAKLTSLFLNNNQLSGCFPASLSALCGRPRSTFNFSNNTNLPGGGNFGAFCTSGAGSDAFRPLASASPNPVCAGTPVSLSVAAGTFYRWGGPAGFAATTQTPVFTPASATSSGVYSVTVGNGSPTCTATATTSLTVNPLPVVSIQGLPASVCQEAAPVSLSGLPNGGVFTIDGLTATTFNPAKLSVGQHTVVYSYTNASGCSATAIQITTIKATPAAPVIVTQSGQSYPGGVSSLTISQNVGNVIFAVSGCAGGTITWAGGNSTTLAASTFDAGVQTFTATCSQNGCTSPLATATLTVVGTTLSVLHRDGNGNASTNTLSPYVALQNDGKTAIPYAEITLRYWLTVENPAPLLFALNYAQVGADKVRLKYVPTTTGNPGATGYIEFSFDASAGSLGAMSNSGPIQPIINKQDYSAFNQLNDYSYAAVGSFTPNERITAYRNGVLFYGLEPGPVVPTQSVKALLQNNTGDGANSIEAVLSVTNDGNVPVNYGDLKVRYYFTADNAQPLVVNQVGYTALGSGNVTGQVVTISPALGGADRYLEVSFSAGLGQLAPGANTGGVTYQIRHADYSGFNQLNDYSYQGTGGLMQNRRVVVFVAGKRAYGTEPVAGARLSVEETPLRVEVLGNPVVGSVVEVLVRGAEGELLTLSLTDASGRSVTTRQVERAGAAERQRLEAGNSPVGLLLLRVSTPSQSQTLKVLKAQ